MSLTILKESPSENLREMRKGTSYFFSSTKYFWPIDGARAAKKSVKHASEKGREKWWCVYREGDKKK